MNYLDKVIDALLKHNFVPADAEQLLRETLAEEGITGKVWLAVRVYTGLKPTACIDTFAREDDAYRHVADILAKNHDGDLPEEMRNLLRLGSYTEFVKFDGGNRFAGESYYVDHDTVEV